MLTAVLLMVQEGFYGMLAVSKTEFKPLTKYGMHWGRNLKFAAAVCNGLVMKGKKGYIGDTLEGSLFRAVEAEFLVGADLFCMIGMPNVTEKFVCNVRHTQHPKQSAALGASVLHTKPYSIQTV